MNTVAWLALFVGALILRGVTKGRVLELPGDLRDMLIAALSGDVNGVKEVAARTGEGVTAVPVAAATEPSGGTNLGLVGSGNGPALVAEMKRLGNGKPYVWGATGPNSYDCSGLVWRAMKNLGIYTGARFTTFTFAAAAKRVVTVVNDPKPGDIVVFYRGPGSGHMGIVSAPGKLYSAASTKLGIGEYPISGFSGTKVYYRLNG